MSRTFALGVFLLLLEPAGPTELTVSSGKVQFNVHEIQDGWVNVGPGTSLHLHPDNPRLARLRELEGQTVDIVLRVVTPPALEKLPR